MQMNSDPDLQPDGQTVRALGVRHYLGVLRRRGLLMLLCIVALPLITYFLAKTSKANYQATSSVLLSDQDLADSLLGVQSTNISASDPTLVPDTEAQVARAPAVLARTLSQVPSARISAHELTENSSASAGSDTNTLTFSVTDHQPGNAIRLVNAYAASYVVYRRQLDTQAISSAITEVNQRLTSAKGNSALYSSLETRLQQLQTLDALETANAQLLAPAGSASRVSPRPGRDAALALLVAIILAAGLALLLEGFDSRVHELDELEDIVGAPRLGMLPPPSRRTRGLSSAVGGVASAQSEAFMLLRAALAFALTSQRHQVLLITSALAQEGKSTTAANLATALARSGKSVCLVDLDLRHPSVGKLFGLPEAPGVTEVLVGEVQLDEAIRLHDTADLEDSPTTQFRSRGNASELLAIATAGVVPPYPVDVGTLPGIDTLIASLRSRYDVVILDSPPAVQVSDALSLAQHSDAILLVTRLNLVTRQALREAVRLLRAAPPLLLGYAVTGTSPGPVGYGYQYGYENASTEPEQVRLRLPAAPHATSAPQETSDPRTW